MLKDYNIQKDFKPFPSYKDRKQWENISQEIKEYYIVEAEKHLNKVWEPLLATRYMDYAKNGNRTRYQSVYFRRRKDVSTMMIAECIEGKGRFIEDIINGVWLICEETTWVIPSHNRHRGTEIKYELGNIEENICIDLFSAETSSTLSWVYYFLEEEINKISPLITRRIELEIDRRIIKPYLEYNYFFWLGLDNDNPVNNWNPWINSNVLIPFLIFTKGEERNKGVSKIIKSANRFYYFYDDDGGCDEGPSYFSGAGASFLDIIEELEVVTPMIKEMYNLDRVKNMARYIYKVYIGERAYVCFADSHPYLSVSASFLSRIGKKINDSNMVGFADYLISNNYVESQYHNDKGLKLFRLLKNIFQKHTKGEFIPPKTSWFKGIEVFTARDKESSLNGLFVAGKGGHNQESHNHNDIGNFILFHNQKPVVIDVGVAAYSKKTFSEQRYEIWSMQSCYHNTPTVNGYDQLPGYKYKGTNSKFNSENNKTIFSLNLEKAYPKNASINSFNRTMEFEHSKSLTITDTYDLIAFKENQVFNLMCHDRPEILEDFILLSNTIKLKLNINYYTIEVDTIEFNEPSMRKDWKKDCLYRLRIINKSKELKNTIKYLFEY